MDGCQTLDPDKNLQVTGSPFLKDLVKGFNWAIISLHCETKGVELPSHLTIKQLLLLFCSEDYLTPK